jgi:methyl-accepting chemotaxis protein
LLALGLAFAIGRSLTAPLGRLCGQAARLAGGDLEARSGEVERDEVGRLGAGMDAAAAALARLRDGYQTRVDEEVRARAELQEKVDELQAVVARMGQGDLAQKVAVTGGDAVGQLGEGLQHLIEDMNRSMLAIARNAQTLAGAADHLSVTAEEMAMNSKETSSQSGTLSANAQQVSRNVQTVATAAEQMTVSIQEIAISAHEATKMATAAVEVAETTNATITKLGASSTEIGNVINVITSIAEQTNLLALNAAIEAGRAGEAGKGFAVVANEVKDLARETGRATGDIGKKIAAIQVDAQEAVNAIREIREVIAKFNDISITIANAVEEQTATTNEIGRNVAEAARGTADIANNIAGVAQLARGAAQGTTENLAAAASLSTLAGELENLVGRFTLEEQAQVSTGAVATLRTAPVRAVRGPGRASNRRG